MIAYTPGKREQRRPLYLMLLAVLFFSKNPILIDLTLGTTDAFFYNAGICLGIAIGVVIYLLLFHKSFITNRRSLSVIYQNILKWKSLFTPGFSSASRLKRTMAITMIWLFIGRFDFAFFAWSTKYVDTTITTITYNMWPILYVLLLSRYDTSGKGPEMRPARYHKITVENLVVFSFAFAGIAILIVGTTGYANLSFDSTSLQIFGMLLAVTAAAASSLNVMCYKWGDHLHHLISKADAPGTALNNEQETKLHQAGFADQTACVMIAYCISGLLAIPFNVAIGLSNGGSIDFVGGFWSVVVGIGFIPGAVLIRLANIMTKDLMVNMLGYTQPLFALLWLAVFSQVEVARADLVVIGSCAVIVSNLLLNLDPEYRPGRLGFKSLILGLWTFGTAIYLRDEWFGSDMIDRTGGEYWGLVALAATIFALLLSFRVSRVAERISAEGQQVITLVHRIQRLTRGGVVNSAMLRAVLQIAVASKPNQRQQAYVTARHSLEEALKQDADKTKVDEGHVSQSLELQKCNMEVDALLYSKQQGSDFSESVAVVLFGITTIGLTLLGRPPTVGFTGFLTEMFTLLLSATLAFLIFNLGDMHHERRFGVGGANIDLLIDRQDGLPRLFASYRSHTLHLERVISLSIAFAVVVAFGVLLFSKWL